MYKKEETKTNIQQQTRQAPGLLAAFCRRGDTVYRRSKQVVRQQLPSWLYAPQ